jgi:RNA polymerase sigma-70 factor (ECF subfamily)
MLPPMAIDEEVKALLSAGDQRAAVERVLHHFHAPVLNYLRGRHDPDDADDVFQLVSLDVERALPGWRLEGRLRAWVFTVARNASHRFLRDPWRQRGVPLPDTFASRLAASLAGQSRMPGGRKEALLALRRRLPQADQDLYVLRVDADLEWSEVRAHLAGEGVEVDEAALRKRFERIKDRLVALAREEGFLE